MKCDWCNEEIIELGDKVALPDELIGCILFHRQCYWEWRKVNG